MAIAGASHGVRTRGGFNVEVKLEGDWFKFQELINNFGPSVMISAQASQRAFANEYKKKVKENIRTGGKKFGYPGHSPKYAKYKSKREGPSRLLYWSGTMLNSVEVIPLAKGRFGVGIRRGVTRPRYKDEKTKKILTVSEYANILEHGTFGGQKLPARPVFSDSLTDPINGMGGKRGMQMFIANDLIKRLRKKGINITRI